MSNHSMNDAERAAKKLLAEINLPSWAVSIWPWRSEAGDIVLRVMIDPTYRLATDKIPSNFQGYSVTVEMRTPNIAFAM